SHPADGDIKEGSITRLRLRQQSTRGVAPIVAVQIEIARVVRPHALKRKRGDDHDNQTRHPAPLQAANPNSRNQKKSGQANQQVPQQKKRPPQSGKHYTDNRYDPRQPDQCVTPELRRASLLASHIPKRPPGKNQGRTVQKSKPEAAVADQVRDEISEVGSRERGEPGQLPS